MDALTCLSCDSAKVRRMANFGSMTIYRCADCGFKFTDSDVDLEGELKPHKYRHKVYDDDDDDEY